MSLKATVLILACATAESFIVKSSQSNTFAYQLSATNVQVCGFKDCKRKGGGPKLEKLINQVLEEENLSESFSVESCDCQGECGYGPNILIDDTKLVNGVRGREAVLQALRISVSTEKADAES